jgi:erythritol kinase (D-erythritol 1-phosphate-forming)
VWAAAASVVAEVAPADGRVDLLAVTGQGDGCWLVDAAGEPVRPAMLWNDARASSTVDDWERDGLLEKAFRVTGSYGNAGLAHAQLSWLRATEPAAADRAATLLSCGSWLWSQLTGRRALDASEAGNPFLDATTGRYADGLLDELGLGWARRLLPEVVTGADRVAALTAAAAGPLGLAAGTPVALAPYDVPATALGVGATRPGDGFAVLGTTLCVGVVADDPGLDRDPAGMSLRTDGRWLLAYATLAGTEVLEWARELLALDSAAALVALAGTAAHPAPPLVLPYLSPAGERAPFRDARAKGAALGLNLEHRPADVARGVLDGLSLAVRDCLAASGAAPDSLTVCGGGARSDAWCQLLADATALPVTRTTQDQVGALGAVLSAPTAWSPTGTVRADRTWSPRDADRLEAAYARFLAARESGATRA